METPKEGAAEHSLEVTTTRNENYDLRLKLTTRPELQLVGLDLNLGFAR